MCLYVLLEFAERDLAGRLKDRMEALQEQGLELSDDEDFVRYTMLEILKVGSKCSQHKQLLVVLP